MRRQRSIADFDALGAGTKSVEPTEVRGRIPIRNGLRLNPLRSLLHMK